MTKKSKLTSKNLSSEADLLRALLGNMNQPVYLKDSDYRYLYVNRQYERLANVTSHEVEGKTDYDIFPKPVADLFRSQDEEVKKLKSLIEFTETIPLPDGEHTFITSKFPLQDTEGHVYAVGGICTDVTANKRTEDKLNKSEKNFRQLVENTNQGVGMMDQNGRLTYVNRSMCEMFGYSENKMLGRLPSDFLDEENQKIFKNYIAKRGKGPVKPYEISFVKKDGSLFHAIVSPQTIKDSSGSIEGSFILISDITESKKLLEERQKTQKLEAIGVLAGGIAHDFNNILAAIMGNINLALFDTELKDKTKEFLARAEKASLRAKDLTQQLLTFAKGGEPVKEVSSLDDIIKDSANFVLHGDNIACQYDIPEDLWNVNIDKGQMSQVIQNIILNASHAMPEGGIITVTGENIASVSAEGLPISKVGRFVKISLHDSGIGIPADLMEKIFEPYFSTKHEGSGLGLAVTQSIINKHNGHILAKSSPGFGTTFTIYLPASEKTTIQKHKSYIEEKVSSQAKILIMDDNTMLRTVAEEMLLQLGHEVVLAVDGEQAIKLYQESVKSDKLFDLVIMDLTIPGGMGGKEAVQEILNIDSDAKVIVSSGYSNDPIMANFKNYGFCSAIAKPYRLQELSKMISHLID